jgi:3-phytase
MADAGVFWPCSEDALCQPVGMFSLGLPGGFPSSDHRLIWVNLRLTGNFFPRGAR